MLRIGIWLAAVLIALEAHGGEPIRLRVEPLTVPPATGPLVYVVAENTGAEPLMGDIRLRGPDEAWQITPAKRSLDLAAGGVERVAFNIASARNDGSNRYPFEVSFENAAVVVTRLQEIFVASAPYFKPAIDGQVDDWKDAIPISFQSGDRETAISTSWNRRRFSLLVVVQEDRLVPRAQPPAATPFDAVQFSLAPLQPLPDLSSTDRAAVAGDPQKLAADRAGRFEFLLAAEPDGGATCFQLADCTTPLELCRQPRPLAALAAEDVELAVWHDAGRTYYECSLPLAAMNKQLQPSEGREFYFSVLVHDTDGTGIRDLAQAAGLWAAAADADDWSRWPGAVWPPAGLLGNRVRWGFCTSKY